MTRKKDKDVFDSQGNERTGTKEASHQSCGSSQLTNNDSLITRSGIPLLMVGFNRRFSPLIQEMKKHVEAMSGPKSMVMTVNAGEIPLDHWTQDPEVGGGRIIGEACHFIDLLRFLAGSSIVDYDKVVMDSRARDTLTIHLKFADGSIPFKKMFLDRAIVTS